MEEKTTPPPTFTERNRNPVNRWINHRLDRITDREIEKYIERYATSDDGVVDKSLANRIDYEVRRRSQMGREIDVLEPGRWTLYSFLLGIFSGAGAKVAGDSIVKGEMQVTRTVTRNALIGTATAGFATAALTGARILSFARFKSGLYAGAQTAVSLHEHPLNKLNGEHSVTAKYETVEPSDIHAASWQSRVLERPELPYSGKGCS